MKLDLSKPKPYFNHTKFASEKYAHCPVIMLAAAVLALLMVLFS